MLHLAAMYNDKAMIALLVENNIKVNHQDKAGRTALHRAVAMNSEDAVELLLGVEIALRGMHR